MTGTFDKLQTKLVKLDALTAAAGEVWPFLKAPDEIGVSQIIRARLWTGTTVAGNVSNYCTFDIWNRTTSVSMVAFSTLTTTPMAADTWVDMTLTATTANSKFAAEDDLQVRATQVASGIAVSAPIFIEVQYWQGGQYNS